MKNTTRTDNIKKSSYTFSKIQAHFKHFQANAAPYHGGKLQFINNAYCVLGLGTNTDFSIQFDFQSDFIQYRSLIISQSFFYLSLSK